MEKIVELNLVESRGNCSFRCKLYNSPNPLFNLIKGHVSDVKTKKAQKQDYKFPYSFKKNNFVTNHHKNMNIINIMKFIAIFTSYYEYKLEKWRILCRK